MHKLVVKKTAPISIWSYEPPSFPIFHRWIDDLWNVLEQELSLPHYKNNNNMLVDLSWYIYL